MQFVGYNFIEKVCFHKKQVTQFEFVISINKIVQKKQHISVHCAPVYETLNKH